MTDLNWIRIGNRLINLDHAVKIRYNENPKRFSEENLSPIWEITLITGDTISCEKDELPEALLHHHITGIMEMVEEACNIMEKEDKHD